MKIQFLKASLLYNDHLRYIYTHNPTLALSSYSEQYNSVMNAGFAWSDFWKKHLESTGLYDVTEIVSNNEPMQKQWALEHKVAYKEESWALDILEAQLIEYTPDVFFAHDYPTIKPEFRLRMKERFPTMTIIGWDGVANNDPDYFAGCDIILSCLQSVVDFYIAHEFKGMFMPAAFETSLANQICIRPPTIACSFIGSAMLGKRKHSERLLLLSYLSQRVPLTAWITSLPEWKKVIRRIISSNIKWRRDAMITIEEICALWHVKRINQGELFGMDMYQTLADSKITVNSHIGVTGVLAGNMRLMEATGMGTCLVTDWKENIQDYFIPDEEVVTYRTPEECAQKITNLLADEPRRLRIAEAGRKRTLTEHTLKKRILEFSDFLITHRLLTSLYK